MKYITFLILFFTSNIIFSQNDPDSLSVDNCRNAFIEQIKVFPQEKIYVHTDRSSYTTGDTLWFKTYLTDAVVHMASENSKFAYVELINPLGNIIKRLKVRLGNNESHGQIEIPSSLPEGNYHLRAYTGTMYKREHDYFFNKNIYIVAGYLPDVKENFHYSFSKDKITASFYFTTANSNEKLPVKEVQMAINDNASKSLKIDKSNIGKTSFSIPQGGYSRIMHLQFEYEGQMFDKFLNIPYPDDEFDVSFFPEGGYLVDNADCLIGVKALNGKGLSSNVTGYVSDNDGNVIVKNVQTLYKGIGSFRLTPQKGKIYYATMTDSDGNTRKFTLPDVSDRAISLSAEWNGDKLKVSVNKQSDTTTPMYLLIHSRGITQYIAKWNEKKPSILFSQKDFPSGVLQILLLDSTYKPISERLVFCNNDDQAHVSMADNKLNGNKNGETMLDISLTDSNNKPLSGNFSISVTNDNFTTIDQNANILTYLLLTSDLRGYIEDPAFYFKQEDAMSRAALDNLMLTQGWKRYDIPQVISGEINELPGFVELGQEITGTVKSISGRKTIENAQVIMISLDNMYANETTTGADGRFVFNGLDFPNNTNYVLQAYNKKGGDMVSLSVDEDEYPAVDSLDLFLSSEKEILEKTNRINNIRSINLDEIVIRTAKIEKAESAYSILADVTFNSDKIKELDAVCVHELLRRIPGVRLAGNKVIIRGTTSIYRDPYASIAIDGIIIDAVDEDGNVGPEFDLDVINMADVERVDVFKSGSAVIWGARGGCGVVSFTTKSGNFDYLSIDKVKYNTKKIKPLGYMIPQEFYTAKYDIQDDYNNQRYLAPTIFWSPNIDSDKDGKTQVNFSLPNKNAAYSVFVQGVTDDGLVISNFKSINN